MSPKLGMSLHPFDSVELYLNAGGGFHSNDARGTTVSINPEDGAPLAPVDPLARQWGAEIGARWQPDRRFNVTTALWWLRSESELVFVGDGGFTEVQGPSRRWGVEVTGFARPVDWLALDASYAWSNADFTSMRGGMDRVPGAIETVASAGVTLTHGPFDGSLRLRYLGAYPLVEDNTQRAGSTTLVNLGAGYRWDAFRFALTVVNLFDSKRQRHRVFLRLPDRSQRPRGGGRSPEAGRAETGSCDGVGLLLVEFAPYEAPRVTRGPPPPPPSARSAPRAGGPAPDVTPAERGSSWLKRSSCSPATASARR